MNNNIGLRPTLVTLLVILFSVLAGIVGLFVSRFFSGKEVLLLPAILILLPLFILSLSKYDTIVLATLCLMGFVWIEPAPMDILSMGLLAVGLTIKRLSPKALSSASLIHLFLWAFVVINLVWLVVTPTLFDSLRYVMISFYLIAFAYFLKMYVTSQRAMRVVLTGYLVSAVVSVMLVIIGYLGIGPAELFIVQSRAKALFKDPNAFGPFLVLMILILMDELWHPRIFPGYTILKGIGIVFLVAGLFLSFSRAAVLNLVLSLTIYLVLKIRELSLQQVMSIVMLGALVGLALVVTVDQLGLLKFLQWRAGIHVYDMSRFATHELGYELGATYPLGIGPGALARAHSLYARTFAEYGIIGTLFLLGCCVMLFVRALSRSLWETGKPSGISAKVVVASFAGLLLNSAVVDTLHWRHFWFIFALAWVVSNWENPPSNDRSAYPSLGGV